MPGTPKWFSPVQEHHIDFLLEEEFAADPTFLTFFLDAARDDNQDFDTRITLETLKSFFRGRDARSRFKAGVLDRALTRFAQTGLQKKDDTMTQFRGFYASKAEAFFNSDEVIWPRARNAWWGDTWFNFIGGPLPKGVEIIHKATLGVVDLAFRHTAQAALEEAVVSHPSDSDIVVVQTGKSASFRLAVAKITDFTLCEKAEPAISAALDSVRRLLNFYRMHSELSKQSIVQSEH